ncbi:MAG TPA: hypothetical protein VHA53_12725 [Nitrolancea sp.]|jgi:hypothetical protein|nr:hypothetical protein [Nitrolancea sp.]
MNDELDRLILLDEIASATVPATVDLWPAIARRVNAGQPRSKTAFARARVWRLGVAVAAVLLSVVVITPVRQSIADTIQHFGIVETSRTRLPQETRAPGFAATAVAVELPLLSLEEAQQQVNYPIPIPTWIPPGTHLRGAFVSGDGSVSLSYVPNGWTGQSSQGGFGIGIRQGASAGLGGYEIPSSAIQHVTVNGSPAIYAHGAWDAPPNSIWHDDADAAMLSWSADGFVYTLSQGELGLSRDDLIRIAESVHVP